MYWKYSLKKQELVYPSINKFMLENGYSVEDMCGLMDLPYSTCTGFLKGKTKAYETIVKLLQITGLTFEEVFLNENMEEDNNAE